MCVTREFAIGYLDYFAFAHKNIKANAENTKYNLLFCWVITAVSQGHTTNVFS